MRSAATDFALFCFQNKIFYFAVTRHPRLWFTSFPREARQDVCVHRLHNSRPDLSGRGLLLFGEILMDVQEMLTELRLQRRRLNRAISALEALQAKSIQSRRIRVVKGKGRRGVVELKRGGGSRRKNGTTGQLIPFLLGRDPS
jgi:hypothetical protein